MATREVIMGPVEVFFGAVGATLAVSIGQMEADEVKIKVKQKQIDVKTMFTGEGIFKTFKAGETVEIEIPLFHEDKYKIWTALKGAITGTTSAGVDQLLSTDPFAGTLQLGSTPGQIVTPQRLVIRQYAVDDSTGVTFTNSTTNPMSLEFYKVVPDEDTIEWMLGVKDTNKHSLKFKAQYDTSKPEGKKLMNWGTGIATT
jgi:hypothetical protein